MVETKSTCASIEILPKPVKANKYILIEVFIHLIWIFFKDCRLNSALEYMLGLVLGCKWATPNGIFLEATLPHAHAL